jgi:hypothetical protein
MTVNKYLDRVINENNWILKMTTNVPNMHHIISYDIGRTGNV